MKLAFALVALLPLAGETTYYFGHHEKFVNIVFESEADIETIVGTTHTVTGEAKIDEEKKTGSVSLTVPVKSLNTGIAMRDEHLQSAMWLDAAKHPDISFVSKKSEPVKDKPGKMSVTGDFSMHGVSKEITVVVDWKALSDEAVAKAQFPPGKWIRFNTTFDVKLSEYGVKVPDMAVSKVSDTWKVKISLFGGTAKIEKK